jgi:hypothetical protein
MIPSTPQPLFVMQKYLSNYPWSDDSFYSFYNFKIANKYLEYFVCKFN